MIEECDRCGVVLVFDSEILSGICAECRAELATEALEMWALLVHAAVDEEEWGEWE